MHVSVRHAEMKDIPTLCDLLAQLFAIETDFMIDASRQARGLSALITSDQALVLSAWSGDRLIGMVTLQTVISTAEGGAVGLVEDLVVDRDCRGRGVGRLLLESLEARARASGITRLQLLADRTNAPALDFYRAMNWSTTRMVVLRRLCGEANEGA
ncbi:GNAT family N-acetyltransferase [Desulfatiferula olefinivorans]